MKNNKGFIKTIIVLIVVLIIINFLGFNIEEIWKEIFYPIFMFLGNMILKIAKEGISIIEKVKEMF